MAILRPSGKDDIVVAAYTSPEGSFAEGAADVSSLVRRIRFP